MTLFFLSQALAFTPPEVDILINNEAQEVWLIQDSRSPWSVVHLCFQSETVVPSLASMETLFSLRMAEQSEQFFAHGVELYQRIGSAELCLQLGALKEEMGWAVGQAMSLISESHWSRREWKEMQQLYQQTLREESARLSSLHQLAEQVIWFDESWVDWDWYFWKINRSYRRFLSQSEMKIVVIGDWSQAEIQQVLPDRPAPKKKVKQSTTSKRRMVKRVECSWVEVEGFPQVAISQRFSFPDLDSTERQYLAVILGHGTRSRLMEELREKRGLLYSLGAQVQGNDIVIRYSLPPESTQEAMLAVYEIMNALTVNELTEKEFLRARGTLLQRYYRTLEDYQQLASVHTLYANPSTWAELAQRRITYPYASLTKQPQFSDYSSIITGLSRAEIEELEHCKTIDKVSFSQLIKLKSVKE